MIFKPFSRQKRITSALRVGSKNPGPGNSCAAPMSAFKSSLLSPTVCPKNPTSVE
jgi:hypothetical protein